MCALQMHVARGEERTQQNISLSGPVSSLLQCCANSAQTILQILRNLASEDLIGNNYFPITPLFNKDLTAKPV